MKMKQHERISEWVKSYAEKNKIKSLVVGVSGGIDSAVVSTLCAMTGLPTHCVLMPIHQNPEHTKRGLNHINWLQTKFERVDSHEFNLSEVYDIFVDTMSYAKSELGFANSRSRLRMTALYQLASSTNGIVVGTGNKIEDFGVGFFTKYGDGGVDISPIADFTKTEVYEIAKHLGINQEIIDATPTDGLWGDDRNDESQIGATYPELEWAMEFKNNRNITDREQEVLSIYKKLNSQNKHKMLPIPIYKKS
jgi:NAD+ synthase